jgi:hypothetical protein
VDSVSPRRKTLAVCSVAWTTQTADAGQDIAQGGDFYATGSVRPEKLLNPNHGMCHRWCNKIPRANIADVALGANSSNFVVLAVSLEVTVSVDAPVTISADRCNPPGFRQASCCGRRLRAYKSLE